MVSKKFFVVAAEDFSHPTNGQDCANQTLCLTTGMMPYYVTDDTNELPRSKLRGIDKQPPFRLASLGTFPQWGQEKMTTSRLFLPPPGEGCHEVTGRGHAHSIAFSPLLTPMQASRNS